MRRCSSRGRRVRLDITSHCCCFIDPLQKRLFIAGTGFDSQEVSCRPALAFAGLVFENAYLSEVSPCSLFPRRTDWVVPIVRVFEIAVMPAVLRLGAVRDALLACPPPALSVERRVQVLRVTAISPCVI